MPYKEKEIKPAYITISQLSKQHNVPISTIRYYESAGVFMPDKIGFCRKYKVSNAIKIARVLRAAKSKIYTVEGLKVIYDNNRLPTEKDLI